MICDECQGTGAYICDDDPENPSPCMYCNGRGEISWWMWLRDKWDWYVVSKWDGFKEWLRWTKIGNRYWRRFGRVRRAKRLAKNSTMLELHAIHGQRLNRLRKWADWIESGDFNVGHQYRVETRLVAEAELACKIKEKESPRG